MSKRQGLTLLYWSLSGTGAFAQSVDQPHTATGKTQPAPSPAGSTDVDMGWLWFTVPILLIMAAIYIFAKWRSPTSVDRDK
ncbi:hypothetical protein FPV16_20575 [Methylobacterium sp. W2]|uniref:hypothetical protein n=1 Tax=Methylobacterium sp. W2 TaxID=2598107 RepID=UPI001D0C1A8E|nr:hypothetical protein [Methylobacterium sp. W2]MCC0808572.1 hypothetical protein [Methylobacterium sp. W2]